MVESVGVDLGGAERWGCREMRDIVRVAAGPRDWLERDQALFPGSDQFKTYQLGEHIAVHVYI